LTFGLESVILESSTKEQTMTYTYSDDCFSDLHKDVYGFRPRGAIMDEWTDRTPRQKQELWNALCDELEVKNAETKSQEERDVAKFEARVQEVMYFGAGDRKTALSWITGQETFYHSQDVEHFVWEQGILFTQYGKKLIEDLLGIVEYKEWA
jgi:hypothetical protein